MICLEDCNIYLKLLYCDCKNIVHERCFKDYILNSREIRCLICKKTRDFSYVKYSSFFDSIFYSLFFFLQNIYFYIDDKFFSENFTFFRTLSAVIFHICLTMIFVMPFAVILYINYSIMLLCKKPYKILTLI
jgi:hypothetical protein